MTATQERFNSSNTGWSIKYFFKSEIYNHQS